MWFLKLSLILLLPFLLHANNGKITFAYPIQELTVDGESKEWTDINAVDFGTDRASASFKTAFNPEKGEFYFLVETNDDNDQFDETRPWFQNDNLAIYLNPLHEERAPTCMMMLINEEGLSFRQPDDYHQLLSDSNVEVKMRTVGSQRFYEGRIKLKDYIQPFRSIGFDLMIVDADEHQTTQYINWGPGGTKEYVSGQLGDLIFLESGTKVFGSLTGQLAWEDEIEDPLPTVIKIKSKQHPNFWLNTVVDSNGRFSIALPVGEYYVLSADKIASPKAGHGDYNQSRIDDSYREEVLVKAKQETDMGTFHIPTFKFPSFLLKNKGILHDYDESKKLEVDNFIQTVCSYYNIPGTSVALIKDSEIVYYQKFGVENLLIQNPVTDTTLFQAASVTKSVFAFIVLRLVEKGVLDLDTPLYKYLAFDNIAHDKFYPKLTARWILSHQSGLPNWAFGGPGAYVNGQKTDLMFEPGTKYQYSGEGFEYLGRVVEHLTKKDLNQLLQEEVMDALNIPPLYFNDDGSLHQARGHHSDGRPTYFGTPGKPGVAHSMLTEAKAFAYFVSALSQQKGLSKETYRQLNQQLVQAEGFESPENLYWDLGVSLGFFVQETPFGKAIMHGGNNGDFQAEFVLYTKKQMGFVVFTNSNTGHKLGQHLGKYLMYGSDYTPSAQKELVSQKN